MSRAEIALKRTGRLIKILFTLFVFAVIGFLLWRAFFSTSLPDKVRSLCPNEALLAAYGEDSSLDGMFTQEQRSITSTERNYGYFSFERSAFIPCANQVQLLIRYNNSTIRATQEDFELSTTPSREDELYDISLVVIKDLTPENKEDNLKGVDGVTQEKIRLYPMQTVSESGGLYNYRLVVFDFGELDLEKMVEDDTLISAFVSIYYKDAVDYGSEAYGTLCIYDYITPKEYFAPTNADRKALEK